MSRAADGVLCGTKLFEHADPSSVRPSYQPCDKRTGASKHQQTCKQPARGGDGYCNDESDDAHPDEQRDWRRSYLVHASLCAFKTIPKNGVEGGFLNIKVSRQISQLLLSRASGILMNRLEGLLGVVQCKNAFTVCVCLLGGHDVRMRLEVALGHGREQGNPLPKISGRLALGLRNTRPSLPCCDGGGNPLGQLVDLGERRRGSSSVPPCKLRGALETYRPCFCLSPSCGGLEQSEVRAQALCPGPRLVCLGGKAEVLLVLILSMRESRLSVAQSIQCHSEWSSLQPLAATHMRCMELF
jgi:hypothetical protein